jgi:uncharacterized damage-inducible protein DinB
MPEQQGVLDAFYEGWKTYQQQVIAALAPLSNEQLALRAAPNLRSINMIVTHMVAVRVRWFMRASSEVHPQLAPLAGWDAPDAPSRTATELVTGLEQTWDMMQSIVAQWTPADFVAPLTHEWQGQTYTLTRQWILWHVLEHDLHHGGEFSISLGIHNLTAPDI